MIEIIILRIKTRVSPADGTANCSKHKKADILASSTK